MDNNKTIFHSAMKFFSGTIISRFTGLLRDVLMAFAFGTNSSLASLMVAFRLSHLMRRLFGEGAMHAAFVPHYESIKQVDPSKAITFFVSVKRALAIVLFSIITLLSLILAFFAYKSPDNEIVFLTLLLMPGLFFICMYSLNSSFLQCEKQFFIPSISPVAFNVIWIIGVVSLFRFTGEQAAPWLAIFIVFASIGQWLFTLRHTQKITNIYPQVLKKKIVTDELKAILGPIFLSIVGVAATQINSALDPLFAKFADSEGPAYLWYSIRLQQFPLGLIGIALGSALLPALARTYKNNDLKNYKNFLENGFQKILYFMIPISLAYIFSGDTCVNLLYGHGDFTSVSLKETTFCLCAYSFGLVPAALVLILAPAFHAKKDYKLPMIVSIASVALNVILNSLFIFYFHWSSFSVALATSISSWFNFISLYVCLTKEIGVLFSSKMIYTLIKMIFICLIALLSLFCLNTLMYQGNYIVEWIFRGNLIDLSMRFQDQITKFLWEVVVFGTPVLLFLGYELRANFTGKNVEAS